MTSTIAFQQSVLQEIERLSELNRLIQADEAIQQSGNIFKPSSWIARLLVWRKKDEIQTAKQLNTQSKHLVQNRDLRIYLCPALTSASDDAFEIAKIVTPILISLHLAGTLVIPPDPMLYASIALIIARMGVSSICSDYESKKDKKQ